MPTPLDRQIALTHAELIRLAVAVREDRDLAPALFEPLRELEEAGWSGLVKAMIAFVNDEEIDMDPLDEEDHAIIIAMQRGLEDKEWLAGLEQDAAAQAAPALAALIYAATQGEREALEAMASLRDAADTPAAVATSAALIAIIEGERSALSLTVGLPEEQARLIGTVLEELASLESC
ncbi:MAG: hypothetical protein ACOZAQ_08085 [Pseudomonadota bacterium]